jgi:hypothetical protein
VSIFKRVIYEKLYKLSNDSVLHSSYKLLDTGVKDSVLAKEIKLQYNIGFADWYVGKGKLTNSINYGRLAFQQTPNDAIIQEIIWKSIVMKYSTSIGNAEDVKILSDYENEFKFLKTNNQFKALLIYNYALACYKSFMDNKGEEGHKLLGMMESSLKTRDKDVMISETQIGLVFAEAGAFYFRKRDFKSAKELLMRGFEYSPNDTEIKERLKIVEDEVQKK